jgi:hypothetical protein
MARFMIALLFFLISNREVQAQSGWEYLDQTPERSVGLLDLPDIVGQGCGALDKRATARVYGSPSEKAAHVGTIYMRDERDTGCGLMIERTGGLKEDVPTLESGYEIGAAIVYERRGSWFRIRLKDGSAWIRRGDQKDFLSYPEILRERLSYILQGWDGTIRETPGPSGTVRPLAAAWKEQLDRQVNIDYLGSRQAGGELWIHVQFVTERCGQSVEGTPQPVRGWIPAYRSSRSPSAWFSSRGC